MTIEKFAETYRLKIKKDECGDKILLAKQGHFYLDRKALCFMALDYRGAISKLCGLGRMMVGDLGRDKKGRLIRDVWIKDISDPEKALKVLRAKIRRTLSPEAKLKAQSSVKKARLARQNQSAGGIS